MRARRRNIWGPQSSSAVNWALWHLSCSTSSVMLWSGWWLFSSMAPVTVTVLTVSRLRPSSDLFHEFVQPCHILVLSSSLPSDGTCNHRLTEQIHYAHWRTSSSLEVRIGICPFQERVPEFEALYCVQHKQQEGLAQLPTQIHSSSSWHTVVVLSGRRESRSG